MIDLKEKFDISELRTLSSYILDPRIKPLMPKSELKQIQEYAIFLETKLTPELVEKLFKGFERIDKPYDVEYRSKTAAMSFDNSTCVFHVCEKQLIYLEIETLADLARLTAANPIPLA